MQPRTVVVVSNIEENKFNELKVPVVKEDRRYRNNHIVRFCSCDMSCMCVGAVGVRVCNCQWMPVSLSALNVYVMCAFAFSYISRVNWLNFKGMLAKVLQDAEPSLVH